MKIGLVGYQGSGKSTFFEWLTGVAPDPSQAHLGQSAMAAIPEPRVEQLIAIYHPKKVTRASLEVVDTPGLSRTHEGNAQRLATIREAGCLIHVIAAYDGSDPLADMRSFDEDIILADMEIVTGRMGRLEETMKKPVSRQEREKLEHERDTLKLVLDALESGSPLRESHLNEEQQKVTRAFRLLSEKSRMVVVNTADDEDRPERFTVAATDDVPVMAIPIGLELELTRMTPEDRAEFEEEMGLKSVDRDHVVRTMLNTSRQMLFLTAGEKEVRTWLVHRGATAVEAAESVHTDLARGFIRAEVFTVSDLVRLGSERELKAAGLVRQEPKDYVVQEDDVLFIKFSV